MYVIFFRRAIESLDPYASSISTKRKGSRHHGVGGSDDYDDDEIDRYDDGRFDREHDSDEEEP